MKSYNHFLHCLAADSVFEQVFNTLNRRHCCERELNKNLPTVHLKEALHSLCLHTHIPTRTRARASVVTLQLTVVYRPASVLPPHLTRDGKHTLRSLTAILKSMCTCLQRTKNWEPPSCSDARGTHPPSVLFVKELHFVS